MGSISAGCCPSKTLRWREASPPFNLPILRSGLVQAADAEERRWRAPRPGRCSAHPSPRGCPTGSAPRVEARRGAPALRPPPRPSDRDHAVPPSPPLHEQRRAMDAAVARKAPAVWGARQHHPRTKWAIVTGFADRHLRDQVRRADASRHHRSAEPGRSRHQRRTSSSHLPRRYAAPSSTACVPGSSTVADRLRRRGTSRRPRRSRRRRSKRAAAAGLPKW